MRLPEQTGFVVEGWISSDFRFPSSQAQDPEAGLGRLKKARETKQVRRDLGPTTQTSHPNDADQTQFLARNRDSSSAKKERTRTTQGDAKPVKAKRTKREKSASRKKEEQGRIPKRDPTLHESPEDPKASGPEEFESKRT